MKWFVKVYLRCVTKKLISKELELVNTVLTDGQTHGITHNGPVDP